jgi:hypothetical protein
MFVVNDENLNKLQWDRLSLIIIKTNKFDDHVLGWLEKLDFQKDQLPHVNIHCIAHMYLYLVFFLIF